MILISIWSSVPFNTVILHSSLEQIPAERVEAGSVDGASKWQVFKHVSVPALRPVINVVILLGLIYTVQTFDIIQVVTGGGPVNATSTLALYEYDVSFQGLQLGQGAAVCRRSAPRSVARLRPDIPQDIASGGTRMKVSARRLRAWRNTAIGGIIIAIMLVLCIG